MTDSPVDPLSSSRDSFHNFRVFDKFIWKNPGVCNNCFARIKDISSPWKEQYRPSIREALTDVHIKGKDGEIGYDGEKDPDSPSEFPRFRSHYPRMTCERCGSVGGRCQPDILSKRKALERIGPLASRLEEQGIDVDRDRMRESVHRAKEKDALQGFDREIFGIAVKMSTDIQEVRSED